MLDDFRRNSIGTTEENMELTDKVYNKNESQQKKEVNKQCNTKNRTCNTQIENVPSQNSSSNSFETYQQEQKKWFGDQRRTLPINNFNIDWAQMRRKLEIRDLGFWHSQRQKFRKPTFVKKQRRKHRNTSAHTVQLNSKGISTSMITAVSPTHNGSRKLIFFFGTTNMPSIGNTNYLKNYYSDEQSFQQTPLAKEEPFGKVDRNGRTAFGRLYPEPGRRHYHVYDNRNHFFENYDIKKLINKTYDHDFRIKTHRQTQWHNRTFDPNYIFTHQCKVKSINSNSNFVKKNRKYEFESLNLNKIVNVTVPYNNSLPTDPDLANYMKLLQGQNVLSLRPKHARFRDKDNNTIFINQENNDTFTLLRSFKVPWDNRTEPFTYKTYCVARKKFYNKTLDIVFSHYIFHKFKCGNTTRDLGYGRMSNVINRWYNRTFVPKFRPDMFYTHNRHRPEKQLNYHRNELNTLHSMMSEGNFDPDRWARLMAGIDRSKSNISKTNDDYDDYEKQQGDESERQPLQPEAKSYLGNQQQNKTSTKPYKSKTTIYPPSKAVTAKPSFFQSVKEKGFGFFKTLFGRPEYTKDED